MRISAVSLHMNSGELKRLETGGMKRYIILPKDITKFLTLSVLLTPLINSSSSNYFWNAYERKNRLSLSKEVAVPESIGLFIHGAKLIGHCK